MSTIRGSKLHFIARETKIRFHNAMKVIVRFNCNSELCLANLSERCASLREDKTFREFG